MVLNEDFVRSARIHEPSAHERMVAAAQARAEAETRTKVGSDDDLGLEGGEEGYPVGYRGEGYGPEWDADDMYEDPPYGYRRPGHIRWHRTVAWVLAIVMGMGVVALTVSAVYRGASSGRQQPPPAPPPGNTRVDNPSAAPGSSDTAEHVTPRR